jgi:hypothetical protein
MLDYNLTYTKNITLSDWLKKPSVIQENQNFDQLLLGLINQPMQILDHFYTKQVSTLYYYISQAQFV